MSDIPKFNPRFNAKELFPKNKDKTTGQSKKTHTGWKWWRMRCAKLRQNPWCERCGLLADQVHHIHPRATHPELMYDWNNLMSLCEFCHHKEHGIGEWKE